MQMNPVESRDKPQPEDNEYTMAEQRNVAICGCSATIHSICVQSAFAPKYSGAIPVLDIRQRRTILHRHVDNSVQLRFMSHRNLT